jgi:hypothetical protein
MQHPQYLIQGLTLYPLVKYTLSDGCQTVLAVSSSASLQSQLADACMLSCLLMQLTAISSLQCAGAIEAKDRVDMHVFHLSKATKGHPRASNTS